MRESVCGRVNSANITHEQKSEDLLNRYAPELKTVPIHAGTFRMGDLNEGGYSNEKPIHQVRLKGFRLMKSEVTFEQYDLYARASSKETPDDNGWGRGNRSVVNVSWQDASGYAQWLSRKTGLKFRLPSEAEWEYAARADTTQGIVTTMEVFV